MPVIREYQSQVNPSGALPARQYPAEPSDFGGPGLTNLGQGIQSFGAHISLAQHALTHQQAASEVTKTDLQMIQAQSELSQQLEQMVKTWKPEDGEIVPRIQKAVQDRLDSINKTPDGQEIAFETSAGQGHFEQSSARMQAHFIEQATRMQAVVMGQQVAVDHQNAVNATANALQQSPDGFRFFEQNFNQMIDNPQGKYAALPAVKREELKRATVGILARSAVEGKIRQMPRVALDLLQNGWMADKLDDRVMPELITQAKTAVHALSIDKDLAYRDQERQRIETARNIANSLYNVMAAHDADPKNPQLTMSDVVNSDLGKYDAHWQGAFQSMLHTLSKENPTGAIKTDPGTYWDLAKRIYLPYGDPKRLKDETDITNAFANKRRLSYNDMKQLRKEFEDSRTPEGQALGKVMHDYFDGVKSQITRSNPLMGKLDPTGDTQLLLYKNEVQRRVDQMRKEGKNPHDLFNDKKPEWVGAPNVIGPFKKTTQESTADIANTFSKTKKPTELPPEKKPKEGESWLEWKKRTEK